MEDYSYTNQPITDSYYTPVTASPPKQRQLIRPLNIGMVIAAILCVWFLFLLAAGYGTLTLSGIPTNATVRVNGKLVTGKSVHLRPGSYDVSVSAPAILTSDATMHISLLQTTIDQPTLKLRSADAVVSSVIGAFGTDEPVDVYHSQWLDNNSWLLGVLLPGNSVIAVHYDTSKQQWVAGYFTATGYQSDLTKLPSDIAAAVKQMETTYAAG